MILRLDQNPAPKRIMLSSDAWGIIHRVWENHLAAVENQKELAASTDLPQGT